MFPTNCVARIGKFRLFVMSMEEELRQNLLNCADAFRAGRDIGLATLGRLSAGDWRFFDRLNDNEKTFTARKYDEVLVWLSANWPEKSVWPAGIPRPSFEPLDQVPS